MLLIKIIENQTFREFIKSKAHNWLPAYFSRYNLTQQENLEISKKAVLEEDLLDGSLQRLQDTLDRFSEILNQLLNNGELAIIFAVKKGLAEMIEKLLKRGADPNSKNRLGLNSLDIALQKQDRDLFAKLIAYKTAIDIEGDFLKALDRTVVIGYSAQTSLTQLETTPKKN